MDNQNPRKSFSFGEKLKRDHDWFFSDLDDLD